MTVAELITKLQECDPQAAAEIWYDDDYSAPIEEVKPVGNVVLIGPVNGRT